MKKCGQHDRVLVARRMTWVDRYKRVRSMTVYVCPVPGCGKMRSNKRIKASICTCPNMQCSTHIAVEGDL